MREREILNPGSRLLLGITEYEIQEVAGQGSNAIVYRAVYKDGVEKEHDHHVLVKELFPWDKDGKIYRKEDGSIFCSPRKRELFNMHKESFREGNRIHLDYLETHPEAASGNINSWYQNGTIYTVYSFEGGDTLDEWVKKDMPDFGTICRLMEKLIDSADTFYRAGFLHLDISPDNILIVPGTGDMSERVLLIDFNCSWNIKERKRDTAVYTGKKDGYSAPEVLLGRTEYFGQCSDLYSVCGVFFYLLTGRKMDAQEQKDKKSRLKTLDECLCQQDIPQTARQLIRQIMCRGLSQSPKVRYQNGLELKEEFRELTDRLNGRGITRAAIWEASRQMRKKMEQQMPAYRYSCQMYLNTEQGKSLEEGAFWEEILNQRKNTLVLGEGGAGKTGLLFRVWKRSTENYIAHKPIVIFIPLSVYTGKGENEKFLQTYILEKLCPGEVREREEYVCLSRVLDFEGPFVFLLDGLNEVSGRRGLLKEIQELSQKDGVQVVVSERKNIFLKWKKEDFQVYTVAGLEREQQRMICQQNKIIMPNVKEIDQLLENRMFMGMYLDVMQDSGINPIKEGDENTGSGYGNVLFNRYYQGIREKLNENFTWEEEEYFAAEYALNHLLPMIAYESERRKSRLLENQVMVQIVEQSYRQLKEKAFLFAFTEYMGNGSRICTCFPGVWEWFDFAVNRLLFEELKLLQKVEEGWSISHQELCRYLGEKGKKNKTTYVRCKWKQNLKKNCKILVICGAVCAFAFGVWTQAAYPFFPGDKAKVKESVTNMALVMGSTYYVLEEGDSILEQTKDMTVENPDILDYAYWHSQMEERIESCSFYAGMYEEAAVSRYLPLAEELKIDADREALKELFTSPREYYSQLSYYLECLFDRLNPVNGFSDYEKQTAVEAVSGYLEICIDLVNWTTASVLKKYPEEYHRQYGMLLQDYPLYRSINETEEKIQSELRNVEKALEDAERELRLIGFGR